MSIMPSDAELEIAHEAVEDVLVERRDARLSLPFHGNGLVILESDGTDSHIIRMGIIDALRIGLKAIENARAEATT